MTEFRLDRDAPSGEAVLDYDRQHLLTYAELLDAADAGLGWETGSLGILGVDPATNPDCAKRCWDSHLARARWIVGDGLVTAIDAFGSPSHHEAHGPLN